MFNGLHTAAQAMIWLAIVEAVGFTAFTAMAILPLVRALKEQNEESNRIHRDQMNILIQLLAQLLAREAKGGKAEEDKPCGVTLPGRQSAETSA